MALHFIPLIVMFFDTPCFALFSFCSKKRAFNTIFIAPALRVVLTRYEGNPYSVGWSNLVFHCT